jgi:hypothetical protein
MIFLMLIQRNLNLNRYIILDHNNDVLCLERGRFTGEDGRVITKIHYWDKSRTHRLKMNFLKAKFLQLLMWTDGTEARIRKDRHI